MKVTEARDVPVNENPHRVDARTLYSAEKAMVVLITLKPGESLKRHITPVDVVFYVLEGRGVVEIGDERREAGPDTVIESPARIPHRWINESGADFRVLVMKLPRPTESTKIL